MNGERRKGGDKRQKEFKQRREASERASEHGEGGGRVETQDSTAGERGLSRRGAGKSSRKMKSGWWRDERRKREREGVGEGKERKKNTGTGKSFPRIKRASRGRHLCQLPVAVSLTFPLFLEKERGSSAICFQMRTGRTSNFTEQKACVPLFHALHPAFVFFHLSYPCTVFRGNENRH